MSVGHARHSHFIYILHWLKPPEVADEASLEQKRDAVIKTPPDGIFHFNFSLPLYYTSYYCSASTGTITFCLSLLCESDPPVFSLHISVEQRLLGLEAAGQRHEDGVDILTLPGVLGRRFKQQHVVGICKLQRRVGGNLRRSLVFGGKPGGGM